MNIKNELILLKNDYDNYEKTHKLFIEISKNIQKLDGENREFENRLEKINEHNKKLEKVNYLFSDKGIRKNLIKDIVTPLNDYIKKYSEKLDVNYRVEIDDEFNAIIYDMGINKISPETLSTGEGKKINLAISLSYLELIKNKKNNSNILFLDEIFANIDSININKLLLTLKDFADKYKTNIIIIVQDYTISDDSIFDRIIKVDKNIFTMITEIKKTYK
jgi:DNA repair exonuclease SbcCD ATPase subunit